MPCRAAVPVLFLTALFPFAFETPAQSDPPIPTPPGRLFEVAGHKMHLHCRGQGSPTVVVEVGIGDISTDWVFVQDAVSNFTRICTYDRSGYAWSEPGPLPATYPQINLELHELLAAAKERGPFVLVGHSFGGPLVRSYTKIYPDEVAGLVLVDTVHEDQRIPIMRKAVLLRGDAKGRPILAPRLAMRPEDPKPQSAPPTIEPVEPPMDKLPLANQKIDQWAVAQPGIHTMVQSELEWSPESLALMAASNQEGSLGARPLLVLTRKVGGYDNNLDVPASILEEERLALQKKLVELSTNGAQRILPCGHNMHIECPGALTNAIRAVVTAVRDHSHIATND